MKISLHDVASRAALRMRTTVRRAVPEGRARRAGAALVAVAVVAAGGVAVTAAAGRGGLPDGVALQVDGATVTEQQVDRRIAVLKALYGIQAPDGGVGGKEFKRDSAKAVAVGMILDTAAQKRKIVIAAKSARSTLDKMIETQLPGGRDAFVQLLRTYGASEGDVLTEIEQQQSVDRLFQEIAVPSADDVSAADVRDYFDAHQADLLQPEQRNVSNIVVTRRGQADAILRQARQGASFAALVSRYSIDESTKAEQGRLGFAMQTAFEDEYAASAFATGEGELFGPVHTTHGWNVGRVLAIHPATAPTFEQAQPSLTQKLQYDEAYATWQSWLTAQIKHADVEYAPAYLPDHPDAPPPAQASVPSLGTTTP